MSQFGEKFFEVCRSGGAEFAAFTSGCGSPRRRFWRIQGLLVLPVPAVENSSRLAARV